MPPRDQAIRLRFEPIGRPVTGAWCPHCALPSAVQASAFTTTCQGAALFHWRSCFDCGRTWELTAAEALDA